MCLSTVQYDASIGLGYGFKIGKETGLLKNAMNIECGNLENNVWHKANEVEIYADDEDRYYNAGFHIWTRAEHALSYGQWNFRCETIVDLQDKGYTLYLVEYKDITYIGQNTIGENGYIGHNTQWVNAPCIIAREMRTIGTSDFVLESRPSNYKKYVFTLFDGTTKSFE